MAPGLPGNPCKIHQMNPNEKPHLKLPITQPRCPTLLAGHSLSLYAFFIFVIFCLYPQSQQTTKIRNKAEFLSHVWTIRSDLELSWRTATAILKVLGNFDCICTSQWVHVQNCVRILGTAPALASLQWPHSKVGIARSITPQSEQRAHKHCHTHAGVQAARRADCDKWRAVGGRTVFQGGLNSKTVWATGSLLTWKGAQKTKHSKIYRRHHAGAPTCPPSRLFSCRIEENKLTHYVV